MRPLTPKVNGQERVVMDSIVSLVVTVGLLIYLTYALLRPEKF